MNIVHTHTIIWNNTKIRDHEHKFNKEWNDTWNNVIWLHGFKVERQAKGLYKNSISAFGKYLENYIFAVSKSKYLTTKMF